MKFGQHSTCVEINHCVGWWPETGWLHFATTIMWRS